MVAVDGEIKAEKSNAVATWFGMIASAVSAHTQCVEFPVREFLAACEADPARVDQDCVLTGPLQTARKMIAS